MPSRDDWPKMPDGYDFDGRHLLTLVRYGSSPFDNEWDVNLLIQEMEDKFLALVVDIPQVSKGYNHYSCLLSRAAHIRASLYRFKVPPNFASAWLRQRLFEQKPDLLPIPVGPTREFCVALLASKTEATLKDIGDMTGCEDDDNSVGPIVAAAKKSLLRLIPHIMPKGDDNMDLYRFVLDHGDFGIHNMLIAMDKNNQPLVTSLFDWETGHIVPAILSDPLMAVTVDLVAGEDAAPSLTRLPDTATADLLEETSTWSRQYFKALFFEAPEYERVIRAGGDARHIWFTLQAWSGDKPGKYFGKLGAWAERRLQELGVNQ
ncbi:hypothetical protein CHGG_06700 [Chaetomium globosum CBS 148.51]|uniref:Aminoglycoside phosphotransferase domain-containing protein n=1 Tax=Chaetomium globosum (strain ATCC 6205 / CBS 148.51 / DSM 1962 / NBRC 6347 / NRRL 1970) TaxID=306901 RepID=Q2H3R5_CHAGB|nr:uncharacterized protein CHGG_06700 [Chaetomium globosum CBS 148.51]EAQ90081.1 hypothetical protein CHGG_06700 [Chaetomium globosum CBS 148.51]